MYIIIEIVSTCTYHYVVSGPTYSWYVDFLLFRALDDDDDDDDNVFCTVSVFGSVSFVYFDVLVTQANTHTHTHTVSVSVL